MAESELPRESAFCAHAILGADLLVVPDTHADPRFADNPLVLDTPHIRFYAGVPLISPEGCGLGTLCVIDRVPRLIGEHEAWALRGLARQVMAQMELRRTLFELNERTRALDAFSSSVAHDLRAPIRAIRSYAELLREGPAEQGPELLGRVIASAGRMDALIEGLLAYARTACADLSLRTAELGTALRDVLQDLSAEVEARQAVLDVPRELPSVRAHPTALRQVLSNLLSNALKFVPAGVPPRIRVKADIRGDRVVLAVSDNGPGIPPEAWDRLFRPFSRLPEARALPGVGIGLAIVKTAVERMGGRVGVDAEPGKGSTFWFDLALDPSRPSSS